VCETAQPQEPAPAGRRARATALWQHSRLPARGGARRMWRVGIAANHANKLVVKRRTSTYQPGVRAHWLQINRQRAVPPKRFRGQTVRLPLTAATDHRVRCDRLGSRPPRRLPVSPCFCRPATDARFRISAVYHALPFIQLLRSSLPVGLSQLAIARQPVACAFQPSFPCPRTPGSPNGNGSAERRGRGS
jgi:hypothetical protein